MRPKPLDAPLDHGFGNIRWRRTRVGRPPSIADVRQQGELAHHESRAADVEKRPVHLAVLIGEDPGVDHLLGGTRHILFGVGGLDPHQEEQALADGPDHSAVDGHGGTAHALQHDPHKVAIVAAK